jgi:hypothetical protein
MRREGLLWQTTRQTTSMAQNNLEELFVEQAGTTSCGKIYMFLIYIFLLFL